MKRSLSLLVTCVCLLCVFGCVNPAAQITAFSFQGLSPAVVATILGTNIRAVVPADTDVTALIATFATTGQRVTVDGIDQTSGASENDFTDPVTYTVIAADNTTTQEYLVTVSFADPEPFQPGTSYSGSLPDGAGYDLYSSATSRGPAGAGISDTDTAYVITGDGDSTTTSAAINGTNTECSGYSFPYQGDAMAQMSRVDSYIQAQGNGTTGVDEYTSYGNVRYYVYLTLTSSDPATTRITVSASVNASGDLSFTYGSTDDSDYVDVFATLSLKATAYATRYYNSEIGPQFGLGTKISELFGRAKIGYLDGSLMALSEGYLLGQVSTGQTTAQVSGGGTLNFNATPGEIYCIMYTLYSASYIDCYGMYGYTANATASSALAASTSIANISAFDPDNAEADIAITIHSSQLVQP